MAAITSSLLSTSISLHNRPALPHLHFINPKPLQQRPKSLPQRSDCSSIFVPRAIGKALKSVIPFLDKDDPQKVKAQLLLTIAKLGRGAEASPEDQLEVERICSKLEALSPTKEPLRSPFLNGKWELVYTTSTSILKTNRPKFLRPNGPIYQAINADTLRAQNIETWPYFNQVTANLVPLNPKKIAVKFDYFKLGGLISIKAPEGARGELEVTYLDETLRISRGDKGNLFVLQMVDRSYRIPLSE